MRRGKLRPRREVGFGEDKEKVGDWIINKV